jgi:hypothetical protein
MIRWRPVLYKKWMPLCQLEGAHSRLPRQARRVTGRTQDPLFAYKKHIFRIVYNNTPDPSMVLAGVQPHQPSPVIETGVRGMQQPSRYGFISMNK